MNVYVDADACPGRSEIVEVCARFALKPVFVANQDVPAVSHDARAEMRVVSGGFDAADDWIVAQARPGDLVMTADLLLAQRVVRGQVEAMNFSGGALTDDVIHELVARRNIQEQLRQMNLPSHKPVPYGKQNRSQLKASLHQWLETRRRQVPRQPA